MNPDQPYLTIRQFADQYPFATEWALRRIIFKNEKFREKCVRRLGGRVLLDVAAVMKFISTQKH